jgi:hypothetical protein
MRNTIFQQLKKSITRILFVLILVAVSLIPVSGVARAQVHQSTCSEIWDTVITVSNSLGATRALRIGQGLFATADHVDNCDVPAPPIPPSAFEAEIVGTVVPPEPPTDFYTDYRPANQPGTITWRVKYSNSSSGFPITFSWSIAALPGAGTWTLIYFDSDFNMYTVNMRGASSATWTDIYTSQVRIIYATTRCTITAVASGNWDSAGTWNGNCSAFPLAPLDVYIPNGMTVDFNTTATTVESLTIGNGGSLSFSVANQLLVSDNAFVRGGTLTLGALGNLAVGVNGALTNLGVMQQTRDVNASVTFLNIGGYGGLTLTPGTNMGITSVRIIGGQVCDTDNTSIWRCFTVTPTTSVVDAGIVFYFAANELNTSVCANVRAWRSLGGQNWIEASPTLPTTSCGAEPYSVSYTGVTVENAGSFFALKSSGVPTVLTLQTFNASSAGSNFYTLLAIGLVGLASLSAVVVWWTFGKRKAFSVGNR